MIKEEDFPIIDRIKLLRKESGLSQAKFADLIGASSGNVGQWERYTTLPGASALRAIALKLGCSTDWILFGKSTEPTTDTTLNSDEKELINAFRLLDREGKIIVQSICFQERRRSIADKDDKKKKA